MAGMFRALNHRNYRLFFGGQTISLIGSWMDMIAMSWLVFQISHSSALLGTVALFSQVPAFVISPLAGVWLDQWDRRKLLIVTQSIAAVVALVIAYLVYAQTIQVWEILLLAFVLGLVSAFDMTGRQAFMVEIVDDRADLSNAIALNSSQFNLARLIGPPIAGVLINLVGIATCFLLNGLSFLAVIGALIAIRVAARKPSTTDRHVGRNLQEGWRYVKSSTPLWGVLLYLSVISFTGGMYSVLMPVFASDVFHGKSDTLGFLLGAVGVGALAGAMVLAARKGMSGIGQLMVNAAIIYGLSLILFAFNRNFTAALIILAFAGFGAMVHMASTNTLLQSLLEDRMRGRVMAFYTMSFMGAMPIGSFISGALAPHIGMPAIVCAAGLFSLVGTFLFSRILPTIRIEARSILTEKATYTAPQPAIAPGQGGS